MAADGPLNLSHRHRMALRYYARNIVQAQVTARMFGMSPEWFSKVLHSPAGAAFFAAEGERITMELARRSLDSRAGHQTRAI